MSLLHRGHRELRRERSITILWSGDDNSLRFISGGKKKWGEKKNLGRGTGEVFTYEIKH